MADASPQQVLSGVHFMLGNHAVVEGALAVGCRFFAGYPITPANEISERMAKRLPSVGGTFLQAEDELCAIYAVVGASLAGAKAMTATASAGYNYMQEGLGYATSAEIPCVVVDVQRCRGENFASQADVMQMCWGPSGDHELVVLAPSNVQELFDYTIRAFNLAEEFRCPVIVMSETTVALMRERLQIPLKADIEVVNRRYTSLPPSEYLPFQPGPNGVPDFAPLGAGYRRLYSLNPHDASGGIEWDPDVFERMYKRICGKIRDNRDRICQTERYLLEDAEIALIAYGSEARPARDAVEMARNSGIKAGLLRLCTVWPVPEEDIREVSSQVRTVFAVEMNMGKYAREIERFTHSCDVVRVTKNRGAIHTPEEIFASIKEACR